MLSDFEQLPTEILHVIFQYSNNICLPMSSIVFSRLLSAEHIYVRFACELLRSQQCATTALSRMLQCRWMSWRIFQKAVRECFAKAERQAAGEQSDDEDDPPQDPPHIQPPNFNDPVNEERLPYLNLRAPVQLPEKVLRGPWSSEKSSFLYYLIWHHVGIDWSLSSRGEVATQGLQAAIEQRDRRAVASLVNPVVGVIPSALAIKSAVMEHGCDQTIVFHLLQAALRAHVAARLEGQPLTDFSFRDPSLWSWAARVKAAGNVKGDWLTQSLRSADDTSKRDSTYDEATSDDFVRACGSEEDGVEAIQMPWLVEDTSTTRGGDGDAEEG